MMKSGRRLSIPVIVACLAGLLSLAAWLFLARSKAFSTNPRSSQGESFATARPVRFKWQFEGAPKMTLRQTGESDYRITFAGPVNFVIFKVEGAAGRTLRFTFADVPAKQWSSVRFLCGYGDDLSDPSFYEPDNTGRSRWQFVGETSVVGDTEVAFSHRFDKDSAYIALRVPYTPDYQQRWLAGPVARRDGVEVVTVGASAEHRPLILIRVGSGDRQRDKLNPCVLMYAREHGDEPDASRVVQGALRFLTGDSTDAKTIRQQFTYLFIPILDPDGVANALHTNSGAGYREPESGASSASVDAIAYARWFRLLIDSGSRLDLVLNFHNPEPRAYPHVLCPRIERGHEKTELGRAVLVETVSQLDGQFKCTPKALSIGPSPGRLGDYLAKCYGSLHVPFEVNSQYPARRLTPDELVSLGRFFVLSSARFLESRQGVELKAVTARTLAQRAAQMARAGSAATGAGASRASDDLLVELKCRREIDQRVAEQDSSQSVDGGEAIPGTLLYDNNSSSLPRTAPQQVSR
jgi:hypothetical protein